MTSVPILDLQAQFATIHGEIEEAIRRVFASQRFILGPEVEALEGELARMLQAKHAIGCASGSDAILLAVASLMPEAGAFEVVTVPFTFFATAGSVVHAGARPRFVDIEPDGFGMDSRLLPAAINERTVAVLPVHLFGQPCDIDEIVAAAGRRPVIEDAAQAIGATCGGARAAGTIGRLGCLSFFPTKNLGGAGDGGMILTNDDPLADRLLKMRVHGGRQMYHHETVGWNSRLDELQAAVLRVKLPRLKQWCADRSARADAYDVLLDEHGLTGRGLVRGPFRRPGRTHSFHQYVVRVPKEPGGRDRDGLRSHLSSAGIATGVYYPVPLHLQPCFRSLGHGRGDFPVSELAADEVLALPIFPELTADQQTLVVRGIAGYFGLA